MELRFSDGASLVYALASLEATAGQSERLYPEHLFLAMCKVCDLGQAEIGEMAQSSKLDLEKVKMELPRLEAPFVGARIDTTRTRRRLRQIISTRPGMGGRLRRCCRVRNGAGSCWVIPT